MLGDLLFIPTVSCVVCVVFITTGVDAFGCKFPNEGCRGNKDCCSGKCVDLHPGTNPRCTRLSLHHTCLYTYQCDDRLRCGTNNTCCAKYWGICTKKADCCDPQHSCFETEGFYYKRCLYSNSATSIRRQGPTMITQKLSEYLDLLGLGPVGNVVGGWVDERFGGVIVRSLALSMWVLLVVSSLCTVAVGNYGGSSNNSVVVVLMLGLFDFVKCGGSGGCGGGSGCFDNVVNRGFCKSSCRVVRIDKEDDGDDDGGGRCVRKCDGSLNCRAYRSKDGRV